MEKDNETITSLAREVMRLSRDDILMHLRFFDRALSALRLEEKQGTEGFATDGASCFYDPAWVLKRYREEQPWIIRVYLHMLLHCVFAHQFHCDQLDRAVWDLAADLAVENVILELGLGGAALERDGLLAGRLEGLKEKAGGLTAERLYRYFTTDSLPGEEEKELRRLFFRDDHSLWTSGERPEMTREQWKKISRLAKTELKSFARRKSGTVSLEKNLEEATKERYDYSEILRRFAVPGEEMAVSQEEFDYVYYTYGLSCYGNLPLIEPLEYREGRKVKEFVIAIDTSGSVQGELVQAFLTKTYNILAQQESFFSKINVHIIQCDAEIQEDHKVTSWEEFQDFLKTMELKGFGGTDFRPVFQYVDELRRKKEFDNLKGLIYFTDGYGTFPEKKPEYDTAFVFIDDEYGQPEVPVWAIKLVLRPEEI